MSGSGRGRHLSTGSFIEVQGPAPETGKVALTPLAGDPVLGVSLGNVHLLRLDRMHPDAPGNKWFKLQGNMTLVRERGCRRLVSFGGAWSNHLHALAAFGDRYGLETVGIVRGEAAVRPSATLRDAERWGMRLLHVSREEYRRRHDPRWQAALEERFSPCLVIPEGGANMAGMVGCRQIGALIRSVLPAPWPVYLPVGTGTTLAGVALELGRGWHVSGVSALRGAHDLTASVASLLAAVDGGQPSDWRILHDFHGGGFARVRPELRAFMLDFEAVHGILLDPVYTGKLLFALHTLLSRGELDARAPVLALHTGGLQGRRGFDWLDGGALARRAGPVIRGHEKP